MKIAGYIFLIIGGLSFLGAAFKGNSVFGPLFWIALGAFLVYRANNKEAEQREKIRRPAEFRENSTVESMPNSNNDQKLDSLEDIQSQLTLRQREAAMCLISFFGGFSDNRKDYVTRILFRRAVKFFGLSDYPISLSQMMSKFSDSDTLINTVITIRPAKAKEFLLLTCYDLVKSSRTPEAFDALFGIANDMGYDRAKMQRLISRYKYGQNDFHYKSIE